MGYEPIHMGNRISENKAMKAICNQKSDQCKQARKEARITCRELAQILGVSVGLISDIEHGRKGLSENEALGIIMVCAGTRLFWAECAEAEGASNE